MTGDPKSQRAVCEAVAVVSAGRSEGWLLLLLLLLLVGARIRRRIYFERRDFGLARRERALLLLLLLWGRGRWLLEPGARRGG